MRDLTLLLVQLNVMSDQDRFIWWYTISNEYFRTYIGHNSETVFS